jgi:hypothetical protein
LPEKAQESPTGSPPPPLRARSGEALGFDRRSARASIPAWSVGGRDHERESAGDRAAAKLGADAMKAKVWTDEERDAKSARSKALGLRPPNRWTPERGGWTPEQIALLGTGHDEAIAKKFGRSRSAVTSQRTLRKIPAFGGWAGGGRGWTKEELALLGTDHDEAVAQQVGRTVTAVAWKRVALKVPPFRDRRKRAP